MKLELDALADPRADRGACADASRLRRRAPEEPARCGVTPRASAARLDLDRFLPYRLSVLTNRVSSAIARQYSDRFDLTIPEWRVMAVLGRHAGPVGARRRRAHRDGQGAGQPRRREPDARAPRAAQADRDDGRITRLSLTAKGRAIYDEVVPLALHLEEVFLSRLTPEERRQFDALMAKLARQAHLLGERCK